MIIYLPNTLEEEYVNLFPEAISTYIYEKKDSEKRSEIIDEYLKENFNIDLDTVIDNVCENLTIDEALGKYRIHVNFNRTEPITGQNINTLVNLIDYGNLEIRGINLINASFNYVQDHYTELYHLYLMKGEL